MASSAEVGSISLSMTVDTSRIEQSVNSCIQRARRQLTSAFNGASSSVQRSVEQINQSIENATNRLNRQNTAIEAQRNTLAGLNRELSRAREKYQEQTDAISRQEQVVKDLEESYANITSQMGPPTRQQAREIENLSRSLEVARNRLNTMNQSATATRDRIQGLSDNVRVANRRLDNMQTEAGQTRRQIDDLNQELQELEQNTERAGGESKKFTAVLKKAGIALAAAFAVKKLIDFGAQCIELGSDLQEVQNVVDVTFPQMSKQVDKFAQNAASSFGLSETMAKKFTGTFGAMAKAFGFNEQAAYEMSTTLTGLAGDVASFYNISQDEAFTKLKAVFSGETEVLKDLGIVMTQTALDSYAMANGFGKTTAKMSEMEKVALRYQFVQDQLASASGDFARTSDGWANQVRVLQLQFDSLKATIGQGLINVLTPVINTIIGKLMSLANAFKAFTEMVTGKKGSGGTSAATAGMEAVSDAADNAGSAASGAGGAAKKAAKDMKGITTGIDELNIIDQGTDSGSGSGSGGAAGGGYQADQFDMGELDDSTSAVNEKLQGIINVIKDLKDLFMQGFWESFGDTTVFDSMKEKIQSIGGSIKEIFTGPEVLKAAKQFADNAAYALGQITGATASIGVTIADLVVGSLAKYLEKNIGRIQSYIIKMFDIGSRIAEISGQFSQAVSEIFAVLRGETFQQIGASTIAIFVNMFMDLSLLFMQFKADILELFLQPIIDCKEQIIQTLNALAEPVQKNVNTISEILSYFGDTLNEIYSSSVHPFFESLKDGFSEILKVVLDAFNTHILPVLQNVAEKFAEFSTSSLQPLIDKFAEFAGKVFECITVIWEEILQPFITWFIETIAPSIGAQIQLVTDIFFLFLETVSEILGNVIEGLSGLIDFLAGIFTGDWKKAWNGINQFFTSIWNTMQIFVNAIFEAIYIFIQNKLTEIQTFWSTTWEAIRQKASDIWEAIKKTISTLIDNIYTKITNVMGSIKTGISTSLENIKKAWVDIWDELKKKTSDIFDGMWATIKGIINKIIGGVESMANSVVRAINKMIEAVNSVADNVPGIDDELIPTIPELHLPRLAQGGFVKANTPQLAMIGDNRHYGEIVAPEDKMQEMVDKAVSMASRSGNSGMNDQYLALMADLLQRIIDLIESMDLTVTIDIREIKKKLADLDKRTGYTLRNV